MTKLAPSGLETTRLAFGTSRLHHTGRYTRQRLLETAADCGIRHFDTAPTYGDGLAELELGAFLLGRRSQFIVATKYGLPPDPLIGAVPGLAFPLRAARTVSRRIGYWHARRPLMTAEGLRDSVEASLRRLATSWIDILLLHEPSRERIESADAILDALTRLRERGLIRAFGLAGGWEGIAGVIAAAPRLAEIVQTGEAEWPHDRPPDISYGVLARGPQRIFAPSGAQQEGLERLRRAFQRRSTGVVLVSTVQPGRLVALAQTAEEVARVS